MFVQPLLSASKGISHVKYEKKLLIMPFLYFFHNIGPNLAQILPQDHTHFTFFVYFPMKYVWDSININNFNWNPEVLQKKLLKPLKITIFWPNLCKNGVPMGPVQKRIFLFFCRNNKNR